MKRLNLSIQIDQPCSEVFWYALNPKNSHKWFGVDEEKTNEWPVKLGSIYSNRVGDGPWTEYKLTEFQVPNQFTLSDAHGSYHVRYVLTPLEDNKTHLDYLEWVDKGELDEPFDISCLETLKQLVEQK